MFFVGCFFFFFFQISRNTRLQVIGKITLCEVLIGLSLWKVGSFPGCDISQFTSVLTIESMTLINDDLYR